MPSSAPERQATAHSELVNSTSAGHRIHRHAQDMPALPMEARFARLPGDRRVFAFVCGFPSTDTVASVLASSDGGHTWTPTGPFLAGSEMVPTDSGVFIGTSRGTLVVAFSNQAERQWDWDPKLKDAPGAKLPLYVTRSLDAGKTWSEPTKLHDAWTGASRDVIETRDGGLVFTTMKLLNRPGRHSVMTYRSDDDGVTWTPSNILDFGGNGDHDGFSEATLIELRDGRLLKYIRTPWARFWRALSTDGGRSWHAYGPTSLESSSAPGYLHRLASGRVLLLWNQRFPEGSDTWPMQGGDGNGIATPASNYREQLSISFSNDDCQTWSPPTVIASNVGSEVSYPYAFEPEPGVLWITAHRWKLRMQLREQDFLN